MSVEEDVDRAVDGRPWIYVAGPMTKGNPWKNCRRGMVAGNHLWNLGWTPIVPHLSSVWDMAVGPLDPDSDDGADGWLSLDFAMISRCDALYRLTGESSGADREVAVANKLGIPVYYESDYAVGHYPEPHELEAVDAE